MMKEYLFFYNINHRNDFRKGKLVKQWYYEYPFLFDEDDLRIAVNQCKMGYHYFEWLTAIIFFHQTGFLSLVEKYECINHKRKKEVLKTILGEKPHDDLMLLRKEHNAQLPDLFLFNETTKDFFFVEVKGPNDRFRKEQNTLFQKIIQNTEKDIVFVNYVKKDLEYNL